MRPIARLTVIGIALPVVLFATAALVDLAPLAIAAVVIALISPSLGHVVYRRTFFTRGMIVRLLGGGVAGLLVVAARGSRDLGAALGIVLVLGAVAPVSFVVGAALDVNDA